MKIGMGPITDAMSFSLVIPKLTDVISWSWWLVFSPSLACLVYAAFKISKKIKEKRRKTK